AVLGLLAGACIAGGGNEAPDNVNPSEINEPVTITIWGEWPGRELRQVSAICKHFTAKYPWITVKSEGGIGDQKIIQSINSGTAPDAVLSFGLDNVGKF